MSINENFSTSCGHFEYADDGNVHCDVCICADCERDCAYCEQVLKIKPRSKDCLYTIDHGDD